MMKFLTSMLVGGLMVSVSYAKEYVLYKKNFVAPTGTVFENSTKDSFKDMKMSLSMQGQTMDGTVTRASSKTESITVKSPTQLEYLFKNADETSSMTMAGNTQAMPESPNPLLGKAVIFELKSGEWSVRGKDGALSEEEKKEAKSSLQSVTKGDAYYGEKPRKVGETWSASKESVSDLLENAEITKADVKITLKEIVQKNGLECAKLEVVIDISGKDTESGANMQMKGTAEVYRSLKFLVDLEANVKASMNVHGDFGGGSSMKMEGAGEILEKTTVKTK